MCLPVTVCISIASKCRVEGLIEKIKNNKYIADDLKPNRPKNVLVNLFNLSIMSYEIRFIPEFGEAIRAVLNEIPDECPFCHDKITPRLIGNNVYKNETAQVVFLCPSKNCNQTFIGYYQGHHSTMYLQTTSIGLPLKKEFHESILNISPSFVEIYNQSYWAEQYNLSEVCGVGYRKALEFLIKDFSIKNHPNNEENIKKEKLGEVIKHYIEDEKVKNVSKRAVWLGNDETHYVRKWDKKDLNDLKILIDLTITMIQGAYDFEKLMEDMPDGKND